MTTITTQFRAAIDRLSLKPDHCAVSGCDELLLCVLVEPPPRPFDPMKSPPPRFACPEHQVWLGECFDEGYPDDPTYSDGLYHAVLRDVADPAWRWLPERMRRAAMQAGFAVRLTPGGDLPYPRFRVATCAGRAWATDGKTLLDVGPAEEAEAMLERADLQVHPASAKPAELARHRLASEHIARYLTISLSERPAQVRTAADAGLGVCWEGRVVVGEAVLPGHVVALVSDLYGAVSWVGGGPLDPVFALRGAPCAILMPIDVAAAERAALAGKLS